MLAQEFRKTAGLPICTTVALAFNNLPNHSFELGLALT